MTNRQPFWNMLEAIVLLEAFIATKDGLLSRTDAISRASSDLRKMALNQGAIIDQTFRNESGISFQMHSMESAFYGKTCLSHRQSCLSKRQEFATKIKMSIRNY